VEPRKEGRKERKKERKKELTPRSRVLLEKLMVTQLVKKFPAFYGTRVFITVLITACRSGVPV
jgi:hypothetical protein